MNSEKVKEIKKALEDNNTEHFPYIDGHKCKFLNYADILTIINELESENERLLEQRNKTYNIWVKDTEELKARIAELEKENESLANRTPCQLVITDENFEKIKKSDIKDFNLAKIMLKQFAERLKEEFNKKKKGLLRAREIGVSNDNFIMVDSLNYKIDELQYAIDNIDETLKEFLK